MRQEHFIARHQAEWQAFDAWLDARGGRPRRARADRDWRGMDDSAVPAAYRRLTQQLGLARRRGYSPQLVERLQALVQRGHDVSYRVVVAAVLVALLASATLSPFAGV